MIIIKTPQQIEKIKQAAAIWKKVRAVLLSNITPGITTLQLDEIAKNVAKQHGATMSFFNYSGFPGNICISVNDELIHGIPSDYALKQNDLVSFDIGVTYDGFICDAAFSVLVEPKTNAEAQKIIDVTNKCLELGLNEIKPGKTVGDIGYAIEKNALENGYKVIKAFSGHGCGVFLHEDPCIPNYGEPNTGVALKEGMILCIEPMIMTGSNKFIINKKDNWTVSSKNKKLTCHCEAMILVTENGYENLTSDDNCKV